MTSRNACAYGRAAATRSCARFIFEVATISIVRVILRVFSTDLMRLLSSRPLAIACRRLLVRLDAASQIGLELLRQHFAGAKSFANLRVALRHELVEAALPLANLRDRHVVDEAVGDGEDDHDLLLDRHRPILTL